MPIQLHEALSDSGIIGMAGKPGGSKTLQSVGFMDDLPGFIITNIDVFPVHPSRRRIFIPGVDIPPLTLDLLTRQLPRGSARCPVTVIWDETHKSFSQWVGRNDLWRDYFSEHRKYGHNWLWISQNFGKVWIELKRVTQSFLICSDLAKQYIGWIGDWLPESAKPFVADLYESEQCFGEPVERFFTMRSRAYEIYEWYDYRRPVSGVINLFA